MMLGSKSFPFTGLDIREQDEAVAPAGGLPQGGAGDGHRRTSLTIEGVRIVVDSGLARVPRYEPGVGITRLVTVRASRASVDQRRGRRTHRAGRLLSPVG